MSQQPDLKRRKLAFGALVVASVLLAGGYLAWAVARGGANEQPSVSGVRGIRQITSVPFVVFLTSPSGQAPYDRVAVASLADPGRRELVGLRCDRIGMTGPVGICVRHSTTVGLRYEVSFFDRSFHVHAHAGGPGIPSRARVSPSGNLAAVTSFVQGDSYLASGAFSTTTSIFRVHSGDAVVASLEQLHVLRDGRRFEPLNRNFWGVTFVNDHRFYATMGTGTSTYLVRGDIAARTLTVVHPNVECPALSPDGTRVAFKKRMPNGNWRFTVLDLASGKETLLAEPEPIDDQLAWSDAGHVLYSFQGSVWSLPADGSGQPQVLVKAAESPNVVRPGRFLASR